MIPNEKRGDDGVGKHTTRAKKYEDSQDVVFEVHGDAEQKET